MPIPIRKVTNEIDDFFAWVKRSRECERHGEAGTSWAAAPRLHNGIALQDDTPLARRRSGAGGVNSHAIHDA